MELQLKDIELAAERLKPILHHTELDMSSTFSAMTGGEIYLKCENRQKTMGKVRKNYRIFEQISGT